MLKDIPTQSPKSIDFNLHTWNLTKMIKLRDTKGLALKSLLSLLIAIQKAQNQVCLGRDFDYGKT